MGQDTVKDFAISEKTAEMLSFLREFVTFQERCISFWENRKGGETVIAATTEVYDKMQDALAKNIRETLTDTNTREL